MKRHWLDHLGDPNTGDPLQIKAAFREEGGHILDGLLSNALYNILLRYIPGMRKLVRVFIKPAIMSAVTLST